MDPLGAYPADRAAALSGVPRSTVHYWARTNVLIPSLSAERVKLWSFADLMGLRTIYWLRQTKDADPSRPDVPRSTMPAVRRALTRLAELKVDLWTEESGPAIGVTPSGEIFTITSDGVESVHRARVLEGQYLDLIRPFDTPGMAGPDLHAPRPHLRIVPGKLAGSPHIARTRIETLALAALAGRGFSPDQINSLYPDIERAAIREALELEEQLNRNLSAVAA
jgi:uncharacterized protein (DUF433 family)